MGLLSGCKETDVLKEIIYGPDAQIVDNDQQQVDNNEENTEEDPDLFAITDSDDSEQKESESVNEDNDEADDSDMQAVETQQNDESPTTGSSGNENSDSEDETVDGKSKTKEKSEEKTTKKTGGKTKDDSVEGEDGEETGEGEGDGETSAEDSGGDGENESDEGEGDGEGTTPTRTYTSAKSNPNVEYQKPDDNGRLIGDLPKNANIVVAAGEAAVMVEMLGENATNHDILFGTSGSLLDNQIATTVFPDLICTDKDGNSVLRLWEGDGSTVMSDENFQKILDNKDNIDACFIVEGESSFSSEQLSQLKSNGIGYVTLYKMNTPENIKKNATLIGQILGKHTAKNKSSYEGINSSDTAKKYNTWVDNVESTFGDNGFNFADVNSTIYLEKGGSIKSNAKNNSLGQYTILVDHWDESANIKIYYPSTGEDRETGATGAAAATAGYYSSPVNYYMQIAGAVNTAATQQVLWNSKTFVDNIYNPGGAWYLSQYAIEKGKNTGIVHIYGKYNQYYAGYQDSVTDTKNSGPILSEVTVDNKYATITGHLGVGNFTKIIATSETIASNLVSSATFSNALSETLTNAETIQGSYDICINPKGIGNWVKGSVESPLESYWISDTFSETSIAKEAVYNFYKDFYRIEEDTDKKDIDFDLIYNQILEGEQE